MKKKEKPLDVLFLFFNYVTERNAKFNYYVSEILRTNYYIKDICEWKDVSYYMINATYAIEPWYFLRKWKFKNNNFQPNKLIQFKNKEMTIQLIFEQLQFYIESYYSNLYY